MIQRKSRDKSVVEQNIKLLVLGGNRKLKSYTPGPAVMVLTIGANDGVAQLPCCTSKGFLPKKMKSGRLFVQQFREELGLPADSLDVVRSGNRLGHVHTPANKN